MLNKFKNWLPALAVFVVSFVVYLLTMAKGLWFVDSGELAACLKTFGLAHATGYPLFLIVGGVFTNLPLGGSPIFLANLFAALSTASAAAVWCKVFEYTLSETNINKQLISWLAVAGAGLLAFNQVVWQQGLSVEVYGLHLAFLGLVALFGFRLFITKVEGAFWGLAFTLSFAFANHLSTIMTLPFVALVVWQSGFLNAEKRPIFLKALGGALFLLASFYAYLPLRASMNPEFNWGNPISWEAFRYHVGGQQFTNMMFAGGKVFRKHAGEFFSSLPIWTGWVAVILLPLGLWWWFKQQQKVFWGSILLLITCLIWAFTYDIADIENYYLLAFASITLVTLGGMAFLFELAPKTQAYLALIFAFIPLGLNFSKTNISQDQQAEAYPRLLLEQVEPNAIIISRLWDVFVASTYYIQKVEGIQENVLVLDKELLRRRWYFNQVNRWDASIFNSPTMQPLVGDFIDALGPFERKERFDAQRLQSGYTKIFQQLIKEQLPNRPIYYTLELLNDPDCAPPAGVKLIPAGLLFKAVPANQNYVQPKLPVVRKEVVWRKDNSRYHEQIIQLMGASLQETSRYAQANNDLQTVEKAKEWLQVLY